jgi:hypothetical protein
LTLTADVSDNPPMRFHVSLVLGMAVACVVGLVRQADGQTYQWIEAEQPLATNLSTRGNPFAPQNDAERAMLSGGAWIGASGPRRASYFAVYDVDVPKAGEYRLYARKFWKHGPYRVSFNNGPWTTIGDDVALLDTVELRPLVCANWTAAGSFMLEAGKNRFRIESTSNDGAIAFDCFLLTDGPFVARGLVKPDERLRSTEPGWFAWDPGADAAHSPIDLRHLNEPYAGSEGRIIARDGRFVHEKSQKPVRFWGVNFGPDIVRLGETELNNLAAMLARRGVNHVRLHGPIYVQNGPDAGKLDDKQIDNTLRAVQILKSHGIYSTLSIYFPLWLSLDEAGGWKGYKNQTPFALLFFDARFQEMYRGWWRELLTRKDPKTGIALKDEPAVLSLEMLNEDSLFFWTFQPRKTIPEPVAEQIESSFARWLVQRYGSLEQARRPWTKEIFEGDQTAQGRVGICPLWRLANVRDARSKDTVAFLYETQRNFYEQTRDYLRKDLGSISLISASNWMTANDDLFGPLEKASYLTGDFIDRHAYYAGVHAGDRAGHAIATGDSFNDRSALRFEQEKPGEGGNNSWNPSADTSYNDKPTMVSEIDWLEPNRFRTEAAWLCAAYGTQQDLDAVTFFAVASPTWQPTLQKFSVMTPVSLGQFPATAMIYRLGLVDEGPLLTDGALNLKDLLELQGGIKGIDSKAAFVGRRRVTLHDGPTSRPSLDLSAYRDDANGIVRSASGQVTIDSKRGLLTINAPRVRAAVGFLNGQPVTLQNLTIHSAMPYGAIAVVSLDGLPIEQSSRLLVQAMSEQRNAGWKTTGSPKKTIEAFGTAPIVVRDIQGTIAFAADSSWTTQLIAANGEVRSERKTAGPTVELQSDVCYYVLTRQ